ncbi:FHA domain-containing protein [Geothrix sp. PMB-07]|uniref:FHA domain-containing protein n=1 Tax=Geothrix sp. PMB-07 TaxID=3068640 RepID=UPI0027413D4E|nr:FHA domain-containing protein [Geothrix sp. PMB-07]WLT31750.1 FHA domain-containing protein [Geothrix sp. PMB-07]
MIVVCPACQARFQYDDNRFGAARAKRFKCPKCSHVFEVLNPGLSPVMPPEPEEVVMAPFLPQDGPTPPAPVPSARTTAKRDREAMLVAAGLQVPGMPPGLKFTLAFLSGPQASTVQVLEGPRTIIGREEGDVVTRDPETSRRHALLEIHRDGTVWISDQESTNGTLVNGERITAPVQLSSQQEFTCGNSTFMLLIRNTEEFQLH